MTTTTTTTLRRWTQAALTAAFALVIAICTVAGQTTQAVATTAPATAVTRTLELSRVSGIPEEMGSQGLLEAYEAIWVAAAKVHGDVDGAFAALARHNPASVTPAVETRLSPTMTLLIQIQPRRGDDQPASRRTTRYQLTLRTSEPDAEQLLDAIVEQVRSTFVEQPPLSIDQVERRLREVQDKLRQVHQQKTLLQKLAAKRAELNLEQIVQRMDELGREEQRLKMEIAAKSARSEAIRRQIDELTGSIQQRIAEDAVKTHLELAAKLRRAEAETIKKQADAGEPIPPTAHTQALVRVAEAEARVAERRAELGESALLDRLTGELTGLVIDLAELNARLAVLTRQLPATNLGDLDWTHLEQLTRSSQVSPRLLTSLEKQEGELHLQEMALRVADAVVVTPALSTQPASHPPTTRPGRRTSAPPG